MVDQSQKQLPAQTGSGERASFWSYFTGQGMANALLGTFMSTYMMLIGIKLTTIAVAMVVVKIWDMFGDSVWGILFDKIHFKSGHRSLPWLKITLVALPITTILIFQIPAGISPTIKLIWFVIAYILWDSAYTISDIPIYNLVTLMTSNSNERNSLLATARFFALVGAFVATISTPIFVSEKVGLTFGEAALFIVFLMVITMAPIAFKGHERVKSTGDDSHYTLKQIFSYVRSNKYLLRYYSGYIISGVALTNAPLDLFVSYYLFGSALFSSLALVVASVPIGVMSILMGSILKHVDKFKLFYWANVAFVIFGVGVYLGGWHSAIVYLILLGLRSIPQGIILTLNLTFTPDLVEYGHYVTGTDARGIAFAFQSFSVKLISLAQPLGLFLLGFFSWQPTQANSFAQLAARHITQTAPALNGLWITATCVPVLGALIGLIPFSFYHLNDHDVQVMAQINAGELDPESGQKQLSRQYN